MSSKGRKLLDFFFYTYGGLFTCGTNDPALVRGGKDEFSHTETLQVQGR